jgi:hypothetical protein
VLEAIPKASLLLLVASPALTHTVRSFLAVLPFQRSVKGPADPTISIPPSDVSRLYSIVVGAAVSPSSPNRYTVPCNAEIRITMVFGAQEFALDARDAITTEGGTCYGTVEASQDGIFRVGSPLKRNVYT